MRAPITVTIQYRLKKSHYFHASIGQHLVPGLEFFLSNLVLVIECNSLVSKIRVVDPEDDVVRIEGLEPDLAGVNTGVDVFVGHLLRIHLEIGK